MAIDIDPLRFADLRLFDEKASEVRVKSLWKDGPAALIFLRHFG